MGVSGFRDFGVQKGGFRLLGSAVRVSLLGLGFSVFRIRISGLRVYDLSLFRLFSCLWFHGPGVQGFCRLCYRLLLIWCLKIFGVLGVGLRGH